MLYIKCHFSFSFQYFNFFFLIITDWLTFLLLVRTSSGFRFSCWIPNYQRQTRKFSCFIILKNLTNNVVIIHVCICQTFFVRKIKSDPRPIIHVFRKTPVTEIEELFLFYGKTLEIYEIFRQEESTKIVYKCIY